MEAARLAHGSNALPPPVRRAWWRRLAGHVREPMALLLLGAAAVSGLALDERLDAAAILVIVVLNTVIALVQEGRAERALAALEALEAPTATVRRDGHVEVVAAAELVPGDVVLLSPGDRVPADGRLLRAVTLEVDEAILTGESLPAGKVAGGPTDPALPLGDRRGCVFGGTSVTRGTATVRIDGTGPRSVLGRIAAELGAVDRGTTPLQDQLANLTARLGFAAVVVAAGTFALVAVRTPGALDEAFLVGVALAVAAVPEGLAAVTTVALALGVHRMAQRGAIVRRLPAVETLGSTDVLVIDKTGTVTENRMSVTTWLLPDGRDRDAPAGVPDPFRHAVHTAAALCNDATLDPPVGDPTELAVLVAIGPDEVARIRQGATRLDAIPFSSERRRMATLDAVDGETWLHVKGAPEAVISRCDGALGAGPGWREHLLAAAEERAARGGRVLALARRRVPAPPDDLEAAEQHLELVALAVLRDPARASAAESVAAVREAGVELVMATGDHPATARAVAAEVGLADVRPITGRDLHERGVPEEPAHHRVYARVDPDQKLALVEQLQRRGHTVAMTGDGVNDAPALRRADIGVALGRTGSDVAREAGDLVITDDDLATIVLAVGEGRGIYDNLRKVVDYLVASNLAEVTVVLTALVLVPGIGVPLLPLQLLWMNLLTDGLPALALGVDPADPALMRQAPRPRSSRMLDRAHLGRLALRGGVLAVAALAAMLVARGILDLPWTAARTVLFSTLVAAQVLYAYAVRVGAGRTRRQHNPWLHRSVGGALALQVLIVSWPPAQAVFDTVALGASAWGVVAVAALLPAPVLRLLARRAPWHH